MADRWNVIEDQDDLIPRNLDDLTSLRGRLLGLGYSRAMVAGCIDFVLGKARGQEVPMSPQSRAQYRKMLTALNGGPPDGAEAGYVPIETAMFVVAAVGLAAALAGPLLEWLPPIIHGAVNTEEDEPVPAAWPELLAA